MKEREIKFRAWDEIVNLMVYDFEETFDHHGSQEYFPVINSEGDFIVGTYDEKRDWYELEMLQYSGLKDKNGKEIYEGDIIIATESFDLPASHIYKDKLTSNVPMKVFFHEGAFKFKKLKKRSVNHSLTGLSIRENGLVVIGNVFENIG